ncbi:MAG: FAD-binding oxidoreductase [Clostridium sp.]|nr:FAD-binding oxidoreductase [Clostridium sp.]
MIKNNIDSRNNKWKGFKECRVSKIVQEDENVKSFYIKSDDGSALPEFIAGQFIAVRLKDEDNSFTKPRQYTLSMNYNKDFYRISVKRESEGYLSKKLCDEVNVGDSIYITVPMGNFVLKDNDRPLVLLGGGIGITPMITMAEEAVKNRSRNIHIIYSIPNSMNHSFKEEIDALAQEDNVKKTTFYTRPFNNDKHGEDYEARGRINEEWMNENLPLDGEFYFCGPVPFMKSVYQNLISMGINKEQINYELFGPGADITK